MNETTILARIADGATDLQSRKVPLDPDAHRWLRIREGGGTVFFETSSDGQAWATFLGAPTPSFAGFARVSVRTPHGQQRVEPERRAVRSSERRASVG